MKRIVLILAVLVLSLTGCSKRIIEKVVYQHDTTYVNRRDSLHIIDSVYVKEYVKGDTVFVDRFRDRYVYRDRWRDSVRIVERHDTTAVQVKVEKPLSWSQKARIGAFPWLLLALAGALVWIFRKFIFK